MTESLCYEAEDLFDAMRLGMYAKLKIMELYPDLGTFVIRSFYEKEPEIAGEVQKLYSRIRRQNGFSHLKNLDLSKFRDDLDLTMMQREMYLASEECLWEITQCGETITPELIEKEFTDLLKFWKSVYYKEPAAPADPAEAQTGPE